MNDRANDPRVLIAEPHPTMRASMCRLLEAEGLVVCAQVADAEEAFRRSVAEQPHVSLLASPLPGGVLTAIQRISEALPRTKSVVFATAANREDLIASIRAGAHGYLVKDMNPDRLPQAIRGVLAGEAAIPRTLVADLLSELRGQQPGRSVAGRRGRVELTEREWQVLRLVSDRLSSKQIGHRLGLSPITVRRHLSSAARKLGARNRQQAVELATRSPTLR
ncbi:MAG: LuxR C-terminal-related transcriptional regulator [Solirubrobacterales bacterium]